MIKNYFQGFFGQRMIHFFGNRELRGKIARGTVVFFSSLAPALGQVINVGEVTINPNTIFSTLSDFENQPSGQVTNNGVWYVYAHFHNDGTTGFMEGEDGQTRFEGDKVQHISGNGSSRFFHVLFNNPVALEAFELSTEIRVGGNVEFREGVVHGGTAGLLLVQQNGTHENTYDGSHVNGYVQKNGDNAFLFPVGNAGFYRMAGIFPEGEASFRARYFLEDPEDLYPRDSKESGIELINDAEYWEIRRVSGDAGARILLSWRDVTTPAFILGEPKDDIHVVRWDEGEAMWKDEGGEVDPGQQTVTTPETVGGYGVFTLAKVESIAVDMHIRKTSLGAQVFQGEEFDYLLTVENNGEREATDVVIVDNLPSGLHYVRAVFESAFGLIEETVQTDVMGNTVTFRIPAFAAGDRLTITLTTRAESPGPVVNFAAVSSRQTELTPADNEDMDENEVRTLHIPNAITPGIQDGYNDRLEIDGLAAYNRNHLIIFNRWGDHVFEADNYQNNWDAKGLPAGTYFYILTVYGEQDRENKFKGWIQVIKED